MDIAILLNLLSDLTVLLSTIVSLSLMMYIWFQTLLVEKLTKSIQPKKLKVYMIENWTSSLPDALVQNYNNVFFQLLSCPFCISFWANLLNIGFLVFVGFWPIYLYCLFPLLWYITYALYLLLVKLEK